MTEQADNRITWPAETKAFLDGLVADDPRVRWADDGALLVDGPDVLAAVETMRQEAPYPAVLGQLVDRLRYKAGWRFYLADLDRGQGSKGLTLVINITGPNSYHPEQRISVNHYMLVPPAAYDVRSWRRWLFDQVLLVERHEAMEFFTLAGVKPYAPSHGPGNDPYLIREVGTDLDQRTSFRGELNPINTQGGAPDDAA